MPLKMFCDRCEEETQENYVSNRGIVSLDGWKATIMLAQNGASNHGILCKTCLRYILSQGPISQEQPTYGYLGKISLETK
jgi:hypothetical protein